MLLRVTYITFPLGSSVRATYMETYPLVHYLMSRINETED